MERGFVQLHELPSVVVAAAVSNPINWADGCHAPTSAGVALYRSWRCAVQLVV